jgi:hypothetical protein
MRHLLLNLAICAIAHLGALAQSPLPIMQPVMTLQNAATAVGPGSVVETSGYGAVTLQITGAFSGTVAFEGTLDKTNWHLLQGTNLSDGVDSNSAPAFPHIALGLLR